MEFSSFTTLVREEVEKRAGEQYTVRINDVRKNNGVVLSGLTMMEDDSNISPTIYLNHYYEDFEDGRTTLTNVVNDVMDHYNRNKVNRSVDMRQFLNYESVKKGIVYKLVNTAKNKELLEDVPHVEFLDLSVVFQYLIQNEHFGTASILIHNAHLKLWDVSVEELYQVADANTQNLQGYELRSMIDAIRDLLEMDTIGEAADIEYMEEHADNVPMYVLSNKNRVGGASCILYDGLLADFATAIGGSFYVIPSSIHEVLLLPADSKDEQEEIKAMIKEINDTQVRTEEILSDSLYFFDKEEGQLLRL
ncbi:MAG: hypothetical protein II247_06610 [Lachnospiraceae bacterium]|nr:hypothetical protein [Lachnospiraceae bacterium]